VSLGFGTAIELSSSASCADPPNVIFHVSVILIVTFFSLILQYYICFNGVFFPVSSLFPFCGCTFFFASLPASVSVWRWSDRTPEHQLHATGLCFSKESENYQPSWWPLLISDE
jgi:hypothetical protein